MKKTISIPVPVVISICVIFLLVILFVPFSHTEYNDGGTEEWAAVTYKIVKWNRLEDDGCIFQKTAVYWGADRYKTIYQLYKTERGDDEEDVFVAYKPVICLYPEVETDVSVKLALKGDLTCTYPAYENGWQVTASPNGTLTDGDGKIYNYLYWEGEMNTKWDMSRGFCIKGGDTAAFLEEALASLGLTRREANEFIVYWLPLMQENEYNIISFQTDVYEDAARLEISPAPDTLIRVFMAYKPSENYIEMEAQELTAPERTGFTAVEWGGTEIN